MKTHKYAVIGTGKTGSYVAEILGREAVTFDETRPPTPDLLKGVDVVVIFVPGSAASEVLDVVFEAGTDAVWGTTGFNWPADLAERLEGKNMRWVTGSNFSLAMNLVRRSVELFGRGSSILKEVGFQIHEIHHTEKQDAPSGTAISWKEWLGKECKITSERVGDIKGIHTLHMETPTESVWLKHEAHSRRVFAEGAVWSAKSLLNDPNLKPGLYTFSELFDKAFTDLL